MYKFYALFVFLSICLSCVCAQTVLGIEANGPDSATIEAYKWRNVNVYQNVYGAAGFKVIIVTPSTKTKVDQALSTNEITHIAGCGHGSPTVYTGYGQGVIFSTSDITLLNKLAGKHIHLLSCLTAQKLGPTMMQQGAKSFAGYHPSFYFTTKSMPVFFNADAEIDRAFAKGKNAPEAYAQTIDAFNEALKIVQQSDPSAVQYMIIDRDGLRCFPAGRKVLDYEFDLKVAAQYLYAKNPETNELVNFADYNNQNLRSSLRDMNDSEVKEVVLANYERMERDFELGILSHGIFHRDQLIDEIRNETVLGKELVNAQKYFLQTLEQSRFSHTVEVTTDANGNIIQAGEADVPMTVYVKSVQAVWSEQPQSFSNVRLSMNESELFNGPVTSGQKYDRNIKVEKGKKTFKVECLNGPKNSKIKITVTFSLW